MASDHAAHPTGRRRLVGAAAALAAMSMISALVCVPTGPAAAGSVGPPVPTLRWSACGGGLQCARATVPLDYDHPRGRAIMLALIRLPAADRAHRIGSVLTNPGGPGKSGVDTVRGTPPGAYPPGMRRRFDIVGFDPRGVGRSSPIRCFPSNAAKDRFFAGIPLFPITPRDEAAFIARTRQLGAVCLRHNAAVMRHMSTANVARDMDLLRRALGDRGLTFYGASYGSYLGNVYANLFPGRVRALVLDSIVEPVAWANGRGDGRSVPVYLRVGSDRGAHATMRQFLLLCERAGPRCAFSAGDPTAKWQTLLAAATRQAPAVYAELVAFTTTALADPPETWSALAGQLQRLYNSLGSSRGRVRTGTLGAGPAAARYDNRDEAFLAVTCADTDNPVNPYRWPGIAAAADRRSGPFGSYWAYLSEPCATWPARDRDRYTGPFSRRTAAPILVVGTRYDPASPYRNAQTVAAQLPGSRLLTLAGWGHVAFGKSTCIAIRIDRYLTTGSLPPAGTTCRPDQQPFG